MRLRLLFPALAAIAMAVIGSLFTSSGLAGWYGTLSLPSWTPPGSVIGLVWSLLFTLFAIGGAIFLHKAGKTRAAAMGMGLMLANAILNISWSWTFFTRHEILLAVWNIALLELSILALIALYRRHSIAAALMLVPYAGWVAFAGYLNWQIHLMNP